jgi:hypothetical protein
VAEVTPLKPGEFRRQHRRAHRRLRLGRLAAAAMLLLAALGGAWALFDGLGLRDLAGGNDDRFASDGRSSAAAGSNSRASGDSVARTENALSGDGLGSGVVHHDRPPPELMRSRMAARDASTDASASDERALSNADVIPAEFAIVVSSRDPAAAEAALSRVVAGLGERGTLVKNFSFAEAQRLAEKHRLVHGGAIRRPNDDDAGPMVAHAPGTTGMPGAPAAGVMSRSDLYDLAQRVRDQLRSDAVAQGETPAIASQTAGDSALAPTLEQQLEFSSRGATHTVAMPASELAALIERLSLDEGQTTLLRMLPEAPASEVMPLSTAPSRDAGDASSATNAGASTEPMLLWLTQGPMVRQAMERLSRDNHIVLVPVMVK